MTAMTLAATRCPIVPPTSKERFLAARAAQRLQYHHRHAAQMVTDPTGDFAPGMPLSLPEISYGLLAGCWAVGTQFRRGETLLTVGPAGRLLGADGAVVILMPGLGR